MSAMTYAARDSETMLRRSMKRLVRYPSQSLFVIGIPIVFLLLFVYVFGGTLGDGLGAPSGGRQEYVNYVVPGIILMTAAAAAQGIAITVAMDMIVVGVALLVGFNPNATAVEWAAAAGLLAFFSLGLIWLCVGLGLQAKSVETASNTPMLLTLLPFLSSGFVPTDSMPTAMRWFAEYQPFTPVIETVRGLLLGTSIGNDGVLAIAWSVVITVVGYRWARRQFNRPPINRPSVLAH